MAVPLSWHTTMLYGKDISKARSTLALEFPLGVSIAEFHQKDRQIAHFAVKVRQNDGHLGGNPMKPIIVSGVCRAPLVFVI